MTKATLVDRFDEVVRDRAVHLADVEAFIASGSEGLLRDRYWVSAGLRTLTAAAVATVRQRRRSRANSCDRAGHRP